MEASAATTSPVPSGLIPSNPSTPWHFSGSVFQRFSQQPAEGSFKKVEIKTSDPEFAFVQRYFQHNQPSNRAIAKVYGVHNWAQTNAFEGSISSMEQEAANPVFAPKWESKSDPLKPLRQKAHQRWTETVSLFSPFTVSQQTGRQRSYKHAKVLPMWHGSSAIKCKSICESGFTFFGKHVGGSVQSTDEGFFGSGIYFTNSARYATDIYSDGQHLLLAWVSMRSPYPVVSDKKGSTCTDMITLQGQGAYENYNAHYIPVVSLNPNDAGCAIYYPCADGETPSCDELVVFQKSQTLHPEACQNEDFYKKSFDIMELVHTHIFNNKKNLSKQERLDFIQIFYTFHILQVFQIIDPKCFNINCKNTADRSAVVLTLLFYVICFKINNSKDDEHVHEHVQLLRTFAHVLSIYTVKRPIDKKHFDRLISALKRLESIQDFPFDKFITTEFSVKFGKDLQKPKEPAIQLNEIDVTNALKETE